VIGGPDQRQQWRDNGGSEGLNTYSDVQMMLKGLFANLEEVDASDKQMSSSQLEIPDFKVRNFML